MPSIPACVALFAGGLLLAFHTGGFVPFLSPDTINDEKFIRNCCVFYGMGTSVDGIVMGANWWHFKTLWAYLGLTDRSLHILMHVSLAGAFVLMVNAGAKMKSQWVGFVGVAVMMAMLWTGVDFRMDMTYNHRGFPFLGSLVLVLGMAAVDSGRVRYLAMAACIAAITTNIHLQASTMAFSIGLVALMMKGNRVWALAAGLGAFVLTAFLTSPTAWIDNVGFFMQKVTGGGPGGGESIPRSGNPFTSHFTAMAIAIELMLVVFLAERRRSGMVKYPLLLLAMIVPKCIVFGGAVALGVTENSDKYLIDVEPAIGLAVGLSVVVAVQSLWKRWGSLARAERILPYGAAMTMALWAPPKEIGRDLDGFPMLQAGDIDAVHLYLTRDKGWNLSMIAQRLKGPANLEMIEYMSVVHPVAWEPPRPGDDSMVTVMKLYNDRVPESGPKVWERIRGDDDVTLWAAWTHTWLDWGEFDMCLGPWTGISDAGRCTKSGIASRPWMNADEVVALEGFSQPESRMDYRLRITFNLKIPDGAGEHRIFMPDIPERCSGRVVDVQGGESEVLDDGRSAVIRATGGVGGTGALTLEWHLGGEGCAGWSYRAFVPSFVEGTSDEVSAIEEAMKTCAAPEVKGRYLLPGPGSPINE